VWGVRGREEVRQKLLFVLRQLNESGGDDESININITDEDETGAGSRRQLAATPTEALQHQEKSWKDQDDDFR
jgi:hypothetical protein